MEHWKVFYCIPLPQGKLHLNVFFYFIKSWHISHWHNIKIYCIYLMNIWVPSHNIKKSVKNSSNLLFIFPWFHFPPFQEVSIFLNLVFIIFTCIFTFYYIYYMTVNTQVLYYSVCFQTTLKYHMLICNMVLFNIMYVSFLMVKKLALSPCCIIFRIRNLPHVYQCSLWGKFWIVSNFSILETILERVFL